jgi:hypothetical protein
MLTLAKEARIGRSQDHGWQIKILLPPAALATMSNLKR